MTTKSVTVTNKLTEKIEVLVEPDKGWAVADAVAPLFTSLIPAKGLAEAGMKFTDFMNAVKDLVEKVDALIRDDDDKGSVPAGAAKDVHARNMLYPGQYFSPSAWGSLFGGRTLDLLFLRRNHPPLKIDANDSHDFEIYDWGIRRTGSGLDDAFWMWPPSPHGDGRPQVRMCPLVPHLLHDTVYHDQVGQGTFENLRYAALLAYANPTDLEARLELSAYRFAGEKGTGRIAAISRDVSPQWVGIMTLWMPAVRVEPDPPNLVGDGPRKHANTAARPKEEAIPPWAQHDINMGAVKPVPRAAFYPEAGKNLKMAAVLRERQEASQLLSEMGWSRAWSVQ
jgi:hypothetical protein